MNRAYRSPLFRAGSALALLAGLAFSDLTARSWADVEINARGWSHENFGRLVLDGAAPLVKSATIKVEGDYAFGLLRTAFSMTTTSLGWETAKYGSAVTTRPNA